MKPVVTFLVYVISLTAFGQTANTEFDGAHWNAPYTLAVPFGWRAERSTVQVPQVTIKGIEDIRYTPGWSNVKSEQYWSYGFLWYLDGAVNTNDHMIEKNLNAYYTNLFEKNISKQNISVKKIAAIKTEVMEIASENGDLKTYYGTIAMVDYMDHKPIVLNCIVHVKASHDQNNTFLFFEVSPQPLNNKIWKSLDQLWLNFDVVASSHKPKLTMNAYFHSESAVGGQ